MFKIKLLTLLFSILLLSSCNTNKVDQKQYSLSYIGGGLDGQLISNAILSNLKMFGMYNKTSNLLIKPSITHTQDVYITNIDKTSDRESITSVLNVEIINTDLNCKIFSYTETEQQFYVIASSVNYSSNTKAVEKIKRSNMDILINNFIRNISDQAMGCIYE